MTEHENPVSESAPVAPAAAASLSAAEVYDRSMNQFLGAASVSAVYSKPVRQGDTVVITAAEVVCGFGQGFGEGTGASGEDKGSGLGGGGGGHVMSRPVAVIVCTPGGVSVQPVIDRGKLWLAALTAAGFMLATLAKMTRSPRG